MRNRYRMFTGYAMAALCGFASVLAFMSARDPETTGTSHQASSPPAPSRFGGMSMEERHQYAARGCREAAEVGLAPAYRGQPGYWPQWDGDHDGISCERWTSAPDDF